MVELSFDSLAFVFNLVVAPGYFAGVAGGIPLVLVAALSSRRVRPVSRAISLRGENPTVHGGEDVTAYVAVVPALGALALGALASGSEDTLGALPGTVGLAVTLAALLGVTLLVRYAGLDAERTLYNAPLGLPSGLAWSFLVFVAPGGFAQWNIPFLDGAAATLAWGVFPAVLAFTPALVGIAVARWRGCRKKVVAACAQPEAEAEATTRRAR
jgi:hypothetical protein